MKFSEQISGSKWKQISGSVWEDEKNGDEGWFLTQFVAAAASDRNPVHLSLVVSRIRQIYLYLVCSWWNSKVLDFVRNKMSSEWSERWTNGILHSRGLMVCEWRARLLSVNNRTSVLEVQPCVGQQEKVKFKEIQGKGIQGKGKGKEIQGKGKIQGYYLSTTEPV